MARLLLKSPQKGAAISTTRGGIPDNTPPVKLPPRGRQYPNRSATPIAIADSNIYQDATITTTSPVEGSSVHIIMRPMKMPTPAKRFLAPIQKAHSLASSTFVRSEERRVGK